MGTFYNFHCLDCGYSAEVSGAADCGFIAQTETMICSTCSEVVDVIVGIQESGQLSEDDLNQCPECEGDKLTPWGEHRPCPRCKGKMEVNPAGSTTLWD
jgi:hypothetical protein